jgi:hypothetical protein
MDADSVVVLNDPAQPDLAWYVPVALPRMIKPVVVLAFVPLATVMIHAPITHGFREILTSPVSALVYFGFFVPFAAFLFVLLFGRRLMHAADGALRMRYVWTRWSFDRRIVRLDRIRTLDYGLYRRRNEYLQPGLLIGYINLEPFLDWITLSMTEAQAMKAIELLAPMLTHEVGTALDRNAAAPTDPLPFFAGRPVVYRSGSTALKAMTGSRSRHKTE